MKEPRHFDLVPADFTGDLDFQVMTAEERGIYCTMIFYLYQNGGYSNLNGVAMATLCNCKNSFDDSWKNIERKFIKTKRGLTHKRVLSEYKAAQQRIQVAVNAGHKGAEKRWGSHSDPNSSPNADPNRVSVAKQSNAKESNTNIAIDSKKTLSFELSLQKLALKYGDELEKILPPKTNREKNTFAKVVCHIAAYCREGRQERSEQIFKDVLDLARKASASNAGSKKALFVSWIKYKYGFNNGVKNE